MKRIEFLLPNLFFFFSTFIVFTTTIAKAQITPDSTLGNESSQIDSNVVIKGLNADQINGGATRGSNLFHSFSQFNINDGQRVYFANPSGVINILTRVTGKDASNIFGILGVNGAANLFLINPNGILFGQNATLDIQGSFVGSTADSIKFGDGKFFNAKDNSSNPLLTINTPIGLQFGANPGKITVQGDGKGIRSSTEIIDTTTGLRIEPDKTLALVGGDIFLEGATLKTAGGRIEIGSVNSEGLVSLQPINKGFALGYNTPNYGNIELTKQSTIDASGEGAGDIQVTGKQVTLKDGSQIEASTLGTQAGGNIVINAQDFLEVIGGGSDGNFLSGIFGIVYQGAEADSGNLTINVGNLLLKDGGTIYSGTSGNGNAGKIEITARDTVSLSGKGFSLIVNNVFPGGVGNTGGIYIKTSSLFASDEALILSNVAGTGNSGRIFIEASDKVSLTGVGDLNLGRNNFDASGTIFNSSVNFGGVGNSGGVVIKTGTLTLDSSQINASTAGTGNSGSIVIEARDKVELLKGSDMFSEVTCACEPNGGGVGGIGNGGDIRITTGSLLLDIGANLRADTEARGNGGNIIIDARDSVTFKSDIRDYSGGAFTQVEPEAVGKGGNISIKTGNLSISGYQEINTRTQGQGNAGNIFINANNISLTGSDVRIISSASKSGRLANTFGNGGNIDIRAGSLSVNDGANILAGSEFSRAAAGNIKIDANRITLKNQSSIKSESVADADGGNINLNLNGFLLLRNNSKISTNAGTEKAGGNGGNINIDTPFIVAVPKEDSDITANAFTGNGGNVNIQAQNIFGIEARPKPTNQSDITASSELGVQGRVSIRQPDVDPTKGIIELPQGLQDQSNQLGQLCGLGRKPLGRFVITGKQGTLPTNPLNLMQGGSDSIPLATLDANNSTAKADPIPDSLMVQNQPPNRIVEAQALVRGADGEMYLVAEAPTATPYSRPGVAPCADVGKEKLTHQN
jgi:filamentous hemagglutinin family protein